MLKLPDFQSLIRLEIGNTARVFEFLVLLLYSSLQLKFYASYTAINLYRIRV